MMNSRHIFFLLLLFVLSACSQKTAQVLEKEESLYVVEVDERNYRLDGRVTDEVEAINELIAPYRAELDKTMDEVIGHTPFELVKSKPNGSLNNWVADLTLNMVNTHYAQKIDIAIQNYGGMRISSLAKGNILVRNIFELMPFDNKVSILELDGNTVNQLFNTILDQGGWPVSRGVILVANKDGTLKEAIINGQAVNPDQKYMVTMPDYIANGNSGCTFLIGQKRDDLDLLIREGMITYLKSINGTDILQPTLEKRIIHE